jgi:uncharacterized protein YdeI (YjbR/CyaY-like superfamily)
MSLPIPDDVLAELRAHAGASERFDRLPPSHQWRYLDWIGEAKRPETRARRIARTVEMILSGGLSA